MVNMPTVYGINSQDAPRISITEVSFTSNRYGTNTGDIVAVGLSDQITCTLNSGNSFTAPTDSIAQYYQGGSGLIQNKMQITYSAENFDANDLPSDGQCEVSIIIGYFRTQDGRRVFSPYLQNTTGTFYQTFPGNERDFNPFKMTCSDLNRNQAFQTTFEINSLANNTATFSEAAILPQNPFTYDIDEVSFSVPTNYTFGQGFDDTAFSMKIQVKLGTGNIIESSFIRLIIPEAAIKTNLLPILPLVSISYNTLAYGQGGSGTTIQDISASDRLAMTLNSGNSFTAPTDGSAEYYEDAQDTEQILSSTQVNIDTSALTLSDFPSTHLLVYYTFTMSGEFGEQIASGGGLYWEGELGQQIEPTEPSEGVYQWEVEVELDSVNTNTLIPFSNAAFPLFGDGSNTDYNRMAKHYYKDDGDYTIDFHMRLVKTDGTSVVGDTQTLTIAQGSVKEVLID